METEFGSVSEKQLGMTGTEVGEPIPYWNNCQRLLFTLAIVLCYVTMMHIIIIFKYMLLVELYQ